MLITEDTLYQIIEDTWNSTLGFQVERSAGPESVGGGALTVCVRITGAWVGEVHLYCPVPLARLIAAAIFQVEAESAGEDEILDALSELVHIVGGNLKTLLPPPVMLSLPSVVDRTAGTPTAPELQLVSRLTLESRGHTFAVTLLRNLPAGAQGEAPVDCRTPLSPGNP
jgi:chemotaxis protein CheX